MPAGGERPRPFVSCGVEFVSRAGKRSTGSRTRSRISFTPEFTQAHLNDTVRACHFNHKDFVRFLTNPPSRPNCTRHSAVRCGKLCGRHRRTRCGMGRSWRSRRSRDAESLLREIALFHALPSLFDCPASLLAFVYASDAAVFDFILSTESAANRHPADASGAQRDDGCLRCHFEQGVASFQWEWTNGVTRVPAQLKTAPTLPTHLRVRLWRSSTTTTQESVCCD